MKATSYSAPDPPAMYRFSLLACLFILAAGCAAVGGTAAGGADAGDEDTVVEGVYSGRLTQAPESTELVLELIQTGRRVSGTYTLRVGGSIQEGRISGLYTAPTLELELPDRDRTAEFVGTVSANGATIEGQYSVGAGANYRVTLRRQ